MTWPKSTFPVVSTAYALQNWKDPLRFDQPISQSHPSDWRGCGLVPRQQATAPTPTPTPTPREPDTAPPRWMRIRVPRGSLWALSSSSDFAHPRFRSRLQMVKLRSKLHLCRQGRPNCLHKCNAAVPIHAAGSLSESGPAELPTASPSSGPTLGTLSEELLVAVASFCDISDILRLRRSCRALHRVFYKSLVIKDILLRLVSLCPLTSEKESEKESERERKRGREFGLGRGSWNRH